MALKLKRRQFSPNVMNRNWDLSNDVYADIIRRQQELEAAHKELKRRLRLLTIFGDYIVDAPKEPPAPPQDEGGTSFKDGWPVRRK